MGYAENIFNGLDLKGQELQDKFAVDLDEMILKMNSSYRVKNEADYEMVLDGLQSEILKQTSTCMNGRS